MNNLIFYYLMDHVAEFNCKLYFNLNLRCPGDITPARDLFRSDDVTIRHTSMTSYDIL